MRSAEGRHPSPTATLVVAAGLSSLGVMPIFLLGSLASLIRADIGMSQSQIGLAVSGFLLAYAVASVPGGRMADRLGARRALGGAALTVLLAASAMGLLASTAAHATALLILAGAAMGVADPGGSVALARGLPPSRQGLAFGLKESAGPGATLLTGLAIPTVALTLGWRWSFGLCALLIAGLMTLLPRLPGAHTAAPVAPVPASGSRERSSAPHLAVLAAAGGLGSAAAIAMSAFFVESVAAAGLSLRDAGFLLAAGSMVGIGARLAAGWAADRRGVGLGLVATMLAGGAVGSVALGAGAAGMLLLAGTALAFGCGWGWAGLFVYTVVRGWPEAAGAAAGAAVAGLAGGAALGPALFGMVSTRHSLQAAWLVNAALAAGAAVLIGGTGLVRRPMSRSLDT